jgi:beta-ureidopropionase / N-carbamoyl-L-amino-acid hydrolase
MSALRTNGERLWGSLMEMAKIGATPAGGVCRLPLTDEDRAGRDLFAAWCREANCHVEVDAFGNMFARRPGRSNAQGAVLAGSHLCTQPTGGRFDGSYGVLAGLEVVRTLNDFEIETDAPVELVNWTNEESSRFAPPMLGSGVFAGAFDLEYALARTDASGARLGDDLRGIGYAGSLPVGERSIRAYFEPHIEQGPILEAESRQIGVVTGANGQRWYELEVEGSECHAGPTPMTWRRDALFAAAHMVVEMIGIARQREPDARSTVGVLNVTPNSRATVPGYVFLTGDLRHPEEAVLTEMDSELRLRCSELAERLNVSLRINELFRFPPQPFDRACVHAVRAAASHLGYSSRDIVSGAGHDAIYVARVAPTAMIFIPCERGISHHEAEYAKPQDCAAGADVLLNVILEYAGHAGRKAVWR